MTAPPVLLVGDANVDLLIRLPERKGPASASEPELFGGGTAANTAVALARLGVPASLVGTIGDDGFGRFVQRDLEAAGVAPAGLYTTADAYTPMVIALIDPSGERMVFVWPPSGGAHLKLHPAQIDHTMVAGAAWLHTSGMCLTEPPASEALLHAMGLARAAGVPVSLDLNLRLEFGGWRAGLREAMMQAVGLADVVLGSGIEEIIPLADTQTVEEAARTLSAGVRTVVARLGGDGALVVSPADTVHVPAFKVEAIDTLGAGDAFNAGFIAARVEGKNIVEAAQWGSAVAALKVTRSGARSTPQRPELERFLAEHSL